MLERVCPLKPAPRQLVGGCDWAMTASVSLQVMLVLVSATNRHIVWLLLAWLQEKEAVVTRLGTRASHFCQRIYIPTYFFYWWPNVFTYETVQKITITFLFSPPSLLPLRNRYFLPRLG